jgi:hypothetical protein
VSGSNSPVIPVHPVYNPYFSACFFSQNSVFFSHQISQQYFSVGLSAQLNGAIDRLSNNHKLCQVPLVWVFAEISFVSIHHVSGFLLSWF